MFSSPSPSPSHLPAGLSIQCKARYLLSDGCMRWGFRWNKDPGGIETVQYYLLADAQSTRIMMHGNSESLRDCTRNSNTQLRKWCTYLTLHITEAHGAL